MKQTCFTNTNTSESGRMRLYIRPMLKSGSRMKKLYCLLCFLCLCTFFVKAQYYEDVVFLKNGDIIHGTVLEQVPNEGIRIQAKDGNISAYKYADIVTMTKEKVETKTELLESKIDPNAKKLNPTSACLWSLLIPGGGQYYNREYSKALRLFGLEVVSIWVAASFGHSTSYISEESGTMGDFYEHKNGFYYGGYGAAVCVWLYSMLDATRSAKAINKRNGFFSYRLNQNTNLALQPDFKLNSLNNGVLDPVIGAKVSLSFR